VSSSVIRSSGVLAQASDGGRPGDGLDVDFGREMAGVGHDDAVSQQRQVGSGQHTPGAGDGDDHIGAGNGLLARRCGEAVQVRSQPGDGVGVDHRHPRAGAAEAGRDPAPARAVPEHRDLLPVGHAVGEPQVGLERALADGVRVEVRSEQVAAVVEDEIRSGRDHLAEVPAVLLPVLRGVPDHGDPLGPERRHRVGLGRVQVAGGH
jgi:hypothetical protein